MKLGLIVRGEDRGLGIQAWEAYRHLHPDRALLIDLGTLARGFRVHAHRYPGAHRVRFEHGRLPEQQVRRWLDGLDVVLSFETLYDWRLADWARDAGVATVVQVNPEFYRHHLDELPHPTAWWAPTSWRLEHLPPDTRVVPVPVALDRFPAPGTREPEEEGPLRVLHVVGRRALADRNGTLALYQALRRVRSRVAVRVVTQDQRLPVARGLARGVQFTRKLGGVGDYWRLYDNADLLLLPRRYGGLCLPAQEAMAAGVAVAMSDASPQRDDWPVLLMRARAGEPIPMPTGEITAVDAEPAAIAEMIDRLAGDREALAAAQQVGWEWAEAHSWAALAGRYETELALAVRGGRAAA